MFKIPAGTLRRSIKKVTSGMISLTIIIIVLKYLSAITFATLI